MSEAILLTGKRGEGKTLIATMVARRYLKRGRLIATNVNFNLDKMAPPWSKTSLIRLPDSPSSHDLQSLPVANSSYDESKNGLLLLDEASGFLNSHDWRDEDTKRIRFWLAQSRKDGWDLLFLCQQEKQIDSQIRNSLFELHATARNLSKIGIPVISFLMMYFFEVKLTLPSMHVFTQRYGFGKNAPVAVSETVSDKGLYECYDTKQKIDPTASDPGHPQVFGSATATMLSAWHLRGRYMGVFQMYGKIAFTALITGLFLGAVPSYFYGRYHQNEAPITQLAEFKPDESKTISGSYTVSDKTHVLFNDGTEGISLGFKADTAGEYYFVNGAWFKKG